MELPKIPTIAPIVTIGMEKKGTPILVITLTEKEKVVKAIKAKT